MLLLKIVLAIIFLAVFALVCLIIRTKIVGSKNLSNANAIIDPIMEKVEQNAPDAVEAVAAGAANPIVRSRLLRRLVAAGKADLMAAEWKTREKIAESDMTFWLMHPNELNAQPSAMQVTNTFAVEENGRKGAVVLLRFFTDPPHWASNRGWMAGMAGIYWEDDGEFSHPAGVFSELLPFEELTPEQHIRLLNKSREGILITPSS